MAPPMSPSRAWATCAGIWSCCSREKPDTGRSRWPRNENRDKEIPITIQVSAFCWVPPFAQGYVRDLRVRWALEEAGLPYEATLIDPPVQASEGYRHWQPFGQVPAYRDGEVEM